MSEGEGGRPGRERKPALLVMLFAIEEGFFLLLSTFFASSDARLHNGLCCKRGGTGLGKGRAEDR